MIKKTSTYQYSVFMLVLVGVILGCGAGAVLRSERLGSDGSGDGVYVADYQLARTVLPVTLKRSSEEDYAIEIGEPRAAGDPSAAYVVRYEGSPFAEDDFSIEVDSKSRLLKSIKLKTTEKTDEIVVKVAESLALLESAPAPENMEEILISSELDPTMDNQVEELKDSMVKASKGKVTGFNIKPVTVGKSKESPKSESRATKSQPKVTVGGSDVSAKSKTRANKPQPDCSVGFCYRASIPYRISFEFENGRKFEKEIGLPNAGPVIAVPLTRAAFVEKVTNITFVDGTPNQITLKKPSEALDFVSIPLEVGKAILRVPAELIKLRFNLSDEEKKLAIVEKARIEAERELKKTRSDSALESSPLKKHKVFMFGSSSGWVGPPSNIPLLRSPIPRSHSDEAKDEGELEDIGGSKGKG